MMYIQVKRLPKNAKSSIIEGLFFNDKYYYESGVNQYTGKNVFFRYKKKD